MGILRTIGMSLCSMIYPLIKTFYTLFYQIARAKFLTDDTINSLSNNIYILVSVVMLFSLGVQLLRSIVNPDLLLDNKKGTTAIVKRVIVSLFLIVLIPIAFSYSFILQDKIISSNVIEKLIVGYNSDKSLGDSNAGQIFAGLALNTVFYPQAESSSVEGLAEDYNKMINDDISLISDVGDYVNEKTDEDSNSDNYVFYFNGLVALVAGIFILYMLVLYCMDVGLRLVKLSFLQLTAPISIMAYLASGKDSLEKWVKEVISTYFGLFVKIGALAFMLFAMGHIDEITGSFGDNDKWVKLFVLIGLLQFVHSAPDLILKLFGVKIGGRGGIRGRLGEMAAVGSLAQKGWDKIKYAGGKLALGAGLGAAALSTPIGFGVAAGAGAAAYQWKKGFRGSTAWRDTSVGRGIRKAGALTKGVTAGLTAKGGVSKSIAAGKEAYDKTDYATDFSIKQANNANLKSKALGIVQSGANASIPNLYKDDGNGGLQLDKNVVNAQSFPSLASALTYKNNNFPHQGDAIVEKHGIKKHERNLKNNDLNNYNAMKSKLLDIQGSLNTSSAKTGMRSLINGIEQGNLNASDIGNNLYDIMLKDGDTEANALDFKNTLFQMASKISTDSSGNLYSESKYQEFFESADKAFSAAEKDYNSLLEDNSLNSIQKAIIKETSSQLDKMSKEQINSINNQTVQQNIQQNIPNNPGMQNNTVNQNNSQINNPGVANSQSTQTTAQANNNVNSHMQSNSQPGSQQVQNNQQQIPPQSNNNGGNNSQTNANPTNMNGATINVQNLNAQNVNADSVNGNLNANRIDAQNLTGNSENFDTTNVIKENSNSDNSSSTSTTASENSSTDNSNNQNNTTNHSNDGVNASAQKAPEEQIFERTDFDDVFDQFYDQDDDE